MQTIYLKVIIYTFILLNIYTHLLFFLVSEEN